MGPGPQDPGPRDSETWDPGFPQGLKVGPQDSPSKFKSGTPGPLLKFKKETRIMVFPHCFTYYIVYEKLRNFFKEIIFHEFSWCPYGSLNKVICFKLILPGFFRKNFITEDLLDIHEKPFEKATRKRKRLF